MDDRDDREAREEDPGETCDLLDILVGAVGALLFGIAISILIVAFQQSEVKSRKSDEACFNEMLTIMRSVPPDQALQFQGALVAALGTFQAGHCDLLALAEAMARENRPAVKTGPDQKQQKSTARQTADPAGSPGAEARPAPNPGAVSGGKRQLHE